MQHLEHEATDTDLFAAHDLAILCTSVDDRVEEALVGARGVRLPSLGLTSLHDVRVRTPRPLG